MALERAGISPSDVDYVNAHSTSTPLGDEIEARAIVRALIRDGHSSKRDSELYVSSTKGATGHLLGAAGAIEALFSAKSIVEGIIPPTANLDDVCDPNVAFEYVSGEPQKSNVDVAMNNSFGFGGTNAALVFCAYSDVADNI